ncbi:MAG: Type II secretion system protein G precursor [Verrucomicrobia bacterium ADurb.Bin345]|nr:MAG: Type II secretion system protein G precursor [Verrucomicrobia bacterium ADurb.Bin345]
MKNKDKRTIKTSSGFTLIEVLLVVVIIGILVGVAIPRLGGRVRQAQIAAAEADVNNVGMALRLYEVDNGTYPPSLQALLSKPGNAPNWRGPYLEKGLPKDPWGNDYLYTFPGSRNPHSYDLKTYGPDGVESADDIGNWARTESS